MKSLNEHREIKNLNESKKDSPEVQALLSQIKKLEKEVERIRASEKTTKLSNYIKDVEKMLEQIGRKLDIGIKGAVVSLDKLPFRSNEGAIKIKFPKGFSDKNFKTDADYIDFERGIKNELRKIDKKLNFDLHMWSDEEDFYVFF